MSILKQAEELSLTPDNLKSLKTIIRHDVIDTFKHLFTSITGLHNGLKETLSMLNSFDLLADDEQSSSRSKIQDLMQELVKQMKADNNDVDELDRLSKNFNKSNNNKLNILNFSDVKSATELSNELQEALATSIKDMNGETLTPENVKQEDIDLYDAPKNSQKINIKNLDLHSINNTLINTKELYYSYIDKNVEIYKLIATNLSNLNSDEIEYHDKLSIEIVEALVESMNEVFNSLDNFKVSYNKVVDEVEQGTKLYKKFEFLNDIIA